MSASERVLSSRRTDVSSFRLFSRKANRLLEGLSQYRDEPRSVFVIQRPGRPPKSVDGEEP